MAGVAHGSPARARGNPRPKKHRELVGGINHELVKGRVNAAGPPYSAARLDPAPG